MYNTESNDLKIIICLKSSDVPVERILKFHLKESQFVTSLKKLWGMSYTVCHAPIPTKSLIFTAATMTSY